MRLLPATALLLTLIIILVEARQKPMGKCDAHLSLLADCPHPDDLKQCLASHDDLQLDGIVVCLTYTHCTLHEGVSVAEFAEIRHNEPRECGNATGRFKWWIRRQEAPTDGVKSESATDATASVDEPAEPTATADRSTEPIATTGVSDINSDDLTTTGAGTLSSVEAATSIPTTSRTQETSDSSSLGSTTTSTTEKIGASCYSTTVYSTSACPVQSTNGHLQTLSCYPTSITSSTCAPSMLCATQPTYGYTICMEKHNEIGVWGTVIASCMGGAVACCIGTLVLLYYQDKRKLQRQLAERERLLFKRQRV
ncbi:hypothetical protein FDECE_1292 [Fusarium decemcellulare]|nr:hypothetical protein FDECE_1292 [Fusarium decemcellulare]